MVSKNNCLLLGFKKISFVFFLFLLFFPIFSFSENKINSEGDPFHLVSGKKLEYQENGKITLDYANISLKELLELLAKLDHKNIIVDDNVQGDLAIHLKDLTWQQAFDAILKLKNLKSNEQNGILWVTKSAEANQNLDSSIILPIYYAKATDLVALLKSSDNHLLSKQASISADARTNTLWLQDAPDRLQAVKDFISKVDVPLKQVMIKARIVSIDENCLQELGVKFSTVNTEGTVEGGGMKMDLPIAMRNPGQFNIAVAKLGANVLLDMELSALENEGKGKIISSPELVTADRTAAYIESGEEIPYQEKTSSGATNVAFKKAVLSLKVTPKVTKQEKMVLNLVVNQDKLSTVNVQGVPAIQTRQIETEVTIRNGETIALGGIFEQTDNHQEERVPVLGHIPIIKNLFKSQTDRHEKRELVIFVTPEIIGN